MICFLICDHIGHTQRKAQLLRRGGIDLKSISRSIGGTQSRSTNLNAPSFWLSPTPSEGFSKKRCGLTTYRSRRSKPEPRKLSPSGPRHRSHLNQTRSGRGILIPCRTSKTQLACGLSRSFQKQLRRRGTWSCENSKCSKSVTKLPNSMMIALDSRVCTCW